MKLGIITLVSDNYGNKFQNYAVEQLLGQYGEVTTYPVAEEYVNTAWQAQSTLSKLHPNHIQLALKSRMMYRFDVTNAQRSLLRNLLYVAVNKNKLLALRKERSKRFKSFADQHLHVSLKTISHENCEEDWHQSDYYFCGSDQIWNPSYATTTDLAFLNFAPEDKCMAIAPSFGVSEIPEARRENYAKWISRFARLSVREEQGRQIIKDLTGREAEVLVDPTMAIPVEQWRALARKPETNMPEKYVLCYFLGRVNKQRRKYIEQQAKAMHAKIVDLFDIEKGNYYVFDPSEVLYCIENAEYVFTDSFHGTVFSILFHQNFMVFDRDEGGAKMNSRLVTLLKKFHLTDRWYSEKAGLPGNGIEWDSVEQILVAEKKKYEQYLKACLQ